MNDFLPLKEKLKSLRASKSLTQKEVADALKMSYRTYQHYEAGTRNPSRKALRSLAEFFDVPIIYLQRNKPLLEIAHFSNINDVINADFHGKLESLQLCYENFDRARRLEASFLITELIGCFCIDNEEYGTDAIYRLREIIDFTTRHYNYLDCICELTNDDDAARFEAQYLDKTGEYRRALKSIWEDEMVFVSDIKAKQ